MTEKFNKQVKITNFYKIKNDMAYKNNNKRNISLHQSNLSSSRKKIKTDISNDIITIVLSDDEEIDNVKNHEDLANPPEQSINMPTNSKKKMYFSPSKKRLVAYSSNHQTSNIKRNLAGDFLKSKNGFNINPTEDIKVLPNIKYNDKTTNFIQMIKNFLEDTSLLILMESEAISMLRSMISLPKPAAIVICRLFWRRNGWYKRDNITDIINKNIYPVVEINKETFDIMFKHLVSCEVLEQGGNQNMSKMEDFTEHLIQSSEIKDICNFFKLKKTTKKEGIQTLKRFAETTTCINNAFIGGARGNMERVLEVMRKRVGECYRLSEKAQKTIYRIYILTYLGVPYDFFRDNTLEHMIDYERRGIEIFPVSTIPLDNASCIFKSAIDFEHYAIAVEMLDEVISNPDQNFRAVVVQQVYNLYKGLSMTELQSYSSLPSWLRRYTPAYVYIQIMLEGLNSLKRSNKSTIYEEAVKILTSLIDQDIFKVHHKAKWCDEKALILHKYLKRSDEAAKELINGFVLDIPEVYKDCLRPRALYLANLKSIKIVDCLRQLLREYGNKPWTQEHTLRSTTVSILPMEKKGAGKSTYEIHNHDGTRDIVGVEECARRWYADNTLYTEGGHWEGKIIINIFFLLFWDIIYSPVPNVPGIYLTRYQRYPNDLFSESFYQNRATQIQQRLQYIKKSDVATILEEMEHIWDSRPVAEQSGISRDARGWRGVVKGLGTSKLRVVCERVARDFRYTHSGFPDLTLYDPKNNKVKFVEVKSDNDKPSMKQLQWMHFLHEHGIDTEFCYVGAKTNAPSSRRPRKTT